MTKNNFAAVEKAVNEACDKAIVSSQAHGPILRNAIVLSILFAAEHGRTEMLNKLYQGVTNSDADGIRQFIVNLIAKYGGDFENDHGVTVKRGFLGFKRKEGFFVVTDKTTNDSRLVAASKEMRDNLIKIGDRNIIEDKELVVGRMDKEKAAETMFDDQAALASFIKRAIANNSNLPLETINGVLDDNHKVDIIKETAKREKREREKLEAAKETIAKAEKPSNNEALPVAA